MDFNVAVKDLLEAGCHFGHQTKRWNPKMKKYIYTEKNGIHIIDVRKTVTKLQEAANAAYKVAKSGGSVLFVGTKKQAKYIVKEAANRCGMPYVTERWLGGMLTNQQTIRKSIEEVEEMERVLSDKANAFLTKKELSMLDKKKEKILKNLSGVRDLKGSPDMVFVVDIINEYLAIREAHKLRIPVAAMVDTNCDPDEVEFCIPSNDDAMKSIQVIVDTIADAVLRGKGETPVVFVEETEVKEA